MTGVNIHIDRHRMIRGVAFAHADRRGNPYYSTEVIASGTRVRWYAYTSRTARALAAELRKTAEAHVDAQARP